VKEVRVIVVRDRASRSSQKAIQGPKDVYHLLARRARQLDREHFWVVHLDAKNTILSLETVSVGTVSASLVHPREALKSAILVGASAVILVHNHPSGNANPSPEDTQTTKRLVKAGMIMGIPVVDHLILDGRGSYVSLKERMPGLFTGGDHP
jgi:DNA repair protein RadC